MPKDTQIFVDEPSRVLERAEACQLEFRESMVSRLEGGYMLPSQADILFDYKEIVGKIATRDTILFSILAKQESLFEPETQITI